MSESNSVTVHMVPARGSRVEKTVPIAKDGAPLEEVLRSAGYSRESGLIFLNSEPIDGRKDVRVNSSDKLIITERVKGS